MGIIVTILTVKSLSLGKVKSPSQGHIHSVDVGSGIQSHVHLTLKPMFSNMAKATSQMGAIK